MYVLCTYPYIYIYTYICNVYVCSIVSMQRYVILRLSNTILYDCTIQCTTLHCTALHYNTIQYNTNITKQYHTTL